MSDAVVWIDGRFRAPHEATVSVFDHVVLYGDGVYDTMMAFHGGIFELDAHLDRLDASARAIGIELPVGREELGTVVVETVRRSGLDRAYVKVILTRGMGPRPLLATEGCRPSLVVFAVPYMTLGPGPDPARGLNLVVSSVRRTPDACLDARVKSCNYLGHVLALREARERGADNALELGEDGAVREAAGFNVFVVRDGVVSTPAENVLRGITRATVLGLAVAAGLQAEETGLDPDEVAAADEMFLTSTAGGVLSATRLEGRPVGRGRPGPVTRGLREAYWELVASGIRSTPVRAAL